MDAIAHCIDLIRKRDEDLYLSLRYADERDRPRLAALFALQTELRRTPVAVSEALLGEIRLAWWREALDEAAGEGRVRAHPVVEALRHTGAMESEGARELAEKLVNARARLLHGEPFSSAGEVAAFLSNAETPLAILALGGADRGASENVRRVADDYAFARFSPVFVPKSGEPVSKGPISEALSMQPSDAGRVAYLALRRGYRRRTDGRPWPLGKRLLLFRAIVSGRI